MAETIQESTILGFIKSHSNVNAVISYNSVTETFEIGLNLTDKNGFHKKNLKMKGSETPEELKKELYQAYLPWTTAERGV